MLILKSFSLLFFLFSFLISHAQGLADYRWESRMVLLIAEDEELPVFKKELMELMEDEKGLAERKLMIIQITPKQSRILFSAGEKREINPSLYRQFKPTENPFSFILVGLDGGVKLRTDEFVSRKYLYALIDGMPMRQAEMREKKNKN